MFFDLALKSPYLGCKWSFPSRAWCRYVATHLAHGAARVAAGGKSWLRSDLVRCEAAFGSAAALYPSPSKLVVDGDETLAVRKKQHASKSAAGVERAPVHRRTLPVDAATSLVAGAPGGDQAALGVAVGKSAAAEKRIIDALLSHFRATPEVREYRKFYSGAAAHRFAIVRVSGDVLTSEEEVGRVAASLAFLHRIGLVPVVVHGAGLFTGRRKAIANAADTDLVTAARKYMGEANAALVAALRKEGVEAAPFTSEIFKAERSASEGQDSTVASISGRIVGVRDHLLASAIEGGRIPVVAALGELVEPKSGAEEEGYVSGDDASGKDLLTFPTQDACIAIAKSIKPLKVVWLRPEGGLKAAAAAETETASAPSIVRSIDFNDPSASSTLHPSDAALLPELRALYDASAGGTGGFSVSVTAPGGLAAELFTSRGEGTVLLRRERILCIEGSTAGEAVDLSKVTALIEEAFGATLPADYFSAMMPATASPSSGRVLRRIYVSEGYRGVAVVTTEPGLDGVAYLDKFAVAKSAQGDKLGEALWKVMMEKEKGKLYWRSRTANRVNPWYFENSEGCFKKGDWTVFWAGLSPEESVTAINTALAIKKTFPVAAYPRAASAEVKAAHAALQPSLK